MKNLNYRESSIPSAIEQRDWVAYAHLQKRRARTKSNFNLEALELAQDKILSDISRKSTGEKLAEDLFRDGKRKACQSYDPSSRIQKGLAEYHRIQEDSTFSESSLHDNFKMAVTIIKRSFSLLTDKQLAVLYIKLNDRDSEIHTKALLNVGIRQFRNILSETRQKLRSVKGFDEAFFLIMIHTDQEELIDFLFKTAKELLTIENAA